VYLTFAVAAEDEQANKQAPGRGFLFGCAGNACRALGGAFVSEDRCRSRRQNISGVMTFCGRSPTSAARTVSAAIHQNRLIASASHIKWNARSKIRTITTDSVVTMIVGEKLNTERLRLGRGRVMGIKSGAWSSRGWHLPKRAR